ncbi:MAG: HD domain-containing protein [Thaumarchaeota archaeon]|nr:HD domain-containing protein [Nitrososphaerota archaeon]
MTLQPVAEIRDPVHGYVKITGVERDVIDSPFVQRLRRVHQLAGSYLVYPGAVHTRFEHVIGAMHVAGQVGETLAASSEMDSDSIQELRLAALLHDVGHGPFSHMYEEVLAVRSKLTHEDIAQRIIRETSLSGLLDRHGFSPKRTSELAVGRLPGRPSFKNEIIAGGLSADMMDYLLRDSYFTGVEFGKVDVQRIVDSLHASEGHLALDQAATYTFEALLLARYEMFKAVYFHRTVRAAELMLVHSMELADGELGLTDLSDLDDYLNLTDEIVLQKLVTVRASNSDLKQARQLALDFRDRKLVKCVFERLVQRRGQAVGQLFAKVTKRKDAVNELAKSAGVDPAQIFLDVPTTPSVPYTSSKEMLTSVRLVRSTGKTGARSVPISELPLVGSIAGFMDVLRVYSHPDVRKRVELAANRYFGKQGRYSEA